ncbi:MAG TPA: hypothetical protein VF670_10800, partial [Duganella sp.]
MSKRIAATTVAIAALAALNLTGLAMNSAVAQESPWLVRVRAVHLEPADKSAPLGGAGASDRITVSDKTIPEIDVSYFFTPNVAAELVLTYPQ